MVLVLVLQVLKCGLVTLIVIMILKDTPTSQVPFVVFIVSLFCKIMCHLVNAYEVEAGTV